MVPPQEMKFYKSEVVFNCDNCAGDQMETMSRRNANKLEVICKEVPSLSDFKK